MALDKDRKLRITPLPPSKLRAVVVLFNPTSYKVSKDVSWDAPDAPDEETKIEKATRVSRRVNSPGLEFKGGKSRSLEMELFFDITETTVVNGAALKDVRQLTNDIVALTRIEAKQKRPPVCLIEWGRETVGSDFPFRGVLTKLVQEFTLFSSTGSPLRAKVSVTFTEFLNPGEDLIQAGTALDVKIFEAGDTLEKLAGKAYNDPSLWRAIANANGIDDPLNIPVGEEIAIPNVPSLL
jgi:Contractile injection system tube protein/LysM domain